jgi:hypothetical protein
MNTKQKAASYAFPSILNIYGIREEQTGMTLRDWFAGMAMQGILSYQGLGVRFNQTASDAFDMADTMIAEREKGGSHE